jgi:hypothetical protein
MNASTGQDRAEAAQGRRSVTTGKRSPRRGSPKPNGRTSRQQPAGDRAAAVAVAAYYRAERRGFAPGNELEDWFEAEHEIDNDDDTDEG